VLVADGEHDMIVNFTFGAGAGRDVLDYTSLGLQFNTGTAVGITNNFANAAIQIGTMADGAIVLDNTVAGNDTLAEIQALFTVADNAAGTATTSLYVTIDDANRTATIYQVENGAAAADVVVTLVDTVTFTTNIAGALTVDNIVLV
jgi:hypothetical protein